MYVGAEAGAAAGGGAGFSATVGAAATVGVGHRIIYVTKPSIFSIFHYLRKKVHRHLHRQHKAASPLFQKLAAKNITFDETII